MATWEESTIVKAVESNIERFDNLTKRTLLIVTRLAQILHSSQKRLGSVQQSVIDGHKTITMLKRVESDLTRLKRFGINMHEFFDLDTELIRDVEKELRALRRSGPGWQYTGTYIDSTIHGHPRYTHSQALRDIITKFDEADRFISNMVKELTADEKMLEDDTMDHRQVFDRLSDDIEYFPKEHEVEKREFLYYLEKLVGVIHELLKVFRNADQLDHDAEARFKRIYTKIKSAERGKTTPRNNIDADIEILEREFR